MKRKGNLYEQVCNFDHLLLAYKKAKSGTRSNLENQSFFFQLEQELLQLQQELLTEIYQPGKYRYFTIKDPKRRTIAVADFRDRIVHHALVGVLEHIFDKKFYYHSYATRKNKGTHKAIKVAQQYLRLNKYYFKADIQKYFDSIDHTLLLNILKHKIKDESVLQLCQKIFENGGFMGKGLPIGNLTSQFFANVYLNELDSFIKQKLKAHYYLRYMDDFVLFHEQKETLHSFKSHIESFLHEQLSLKLNKAYSTLNYSSNGLPFLGANIFNNTIRVRGKTLKRILKKIELRETQYKNSEITEDRFIASMNSLWSFLDHFDTYQLKKHILQKENRL